ncbi:class I SAM-dependent methyltransferase [Iningainema tapete]|uniref:class I SAM-dependent methyltransferase n=1 Tax=Iningainema tapete TaxID=2806730 RepID=UPI003B5883B3
MSRKTALDFGCGVGRLSQAMVQYFETVHGVDISPSMLKLADKYNQHGSKCKYHLNDQDNLKLFPDNYFDFIYSKITLQHMEPQYSRRYIREFLRILAPQGLLIFQIPSQSTLEPAPHNKI